MHPSTANKVLTDEDTLDIGKTAEALKEKQRIDAKKRKRTGGPWASANAWMRKKAREQEEEGERQKIARVWNKHHKKQVDN